LADLQQDLRKKEMQHRNNNNNNNIPEPSALRIHWDFLPPGDAHNRCDAAAAHWKKPQKTAIRDFCVLTTVGHLAFACSEMKNCYMIEAECHEFPDPLECLIEEPWIQTAFHFSYGVPEEEVKRCKCRCLDKTNCLHPCCKKETRRSCVKITIQDRDKQYVTFLSVFSFCFFFILFLFLFFFFFACESRSRTAEHTLWLDNDVPARGELAPLQEDAFWGSPTRTRYHAICGPRVSALNAEDQRIYDYDMGNSDNDGQMDNSGDDYTG
jgi:hypothetical protein